ncbi:phosphoenolpyruvate--protein phosphotransferase [Acanthopleuribacter pedis]|uniref:Phosphoenolpyruvate-protein phosphotransferase n=1 Tax=Acanthopleuribacter pedis TaxID=442870 RepID=A0A8J7Q7R4_9BACT|nr:phosphoenolpyruvate--protein phosphotransferase [Acanthopleuribacter pedis]MBO1318909.1 phosphoenolpyruvate--protein phosphotransferase [Acanthopleuribacter pedis]
METLKGVGVSNGIVIGKALVILDEETVTIEETISADQVEEEIQRFLSALDSAKGQIRTIKDQIKDRIGEEHAFIFDTHILLLDDGTLKNETIKFIRTNSCSCEWAFSQVLMRVLREFSSLGDTYFVERGNDLKDVGKRVLQVLMGERNKHFGFDNLSQDVIVIGSEFGPSNITNFDNPRIHGFATDFGGQTTHTAIIAKALDLPAVVGLHDITKRVKSGQTVILDSFSGKVIVNPNEQTLQKYRKLIHLYKQEEENYRAELSEPATSVDGLEIELLANIELATEMNGAIANGARGVGLYRTEFLFLACDPALPTEETHYDTYCQIAKQVGDDIVTIRTLDLGGEKFFNRAFVREKEVNPVMGVRGVRLCLIRKDIFRTQLRAILRAAKEYKNIRIMFPLISGVREWRVTRDFLNEVMDELRAEGIPFEENPTLGVMIEVPSAAMVADLLAEEVSFFSIGTNDLIQYFLAIDRANDDVSYLYDPLHPGFVRLLSSVIEAANKKGIDVSCCGEMASSPLYACLLILLGLRKLSMNPSSLPIIHHMIRVMDFKKLSTLISDPAGGPTGDHTREAFLKAFRQLLQPNDYTHLIGEDDDEDEA